MSAVQRVKFLWDASMTLSISAKHLNNLLKSNLRNTCRELAGTNTAIPLERFSESQMCRCCLHWQGNDFQLKYKVPKMQITTNKAKKLLKKLHDKQQSNGRSQGLSRKQKMRAKWLLKRAKNRLVIDCNFCQRKTCIILENPEQLKKTKSVISMEVARTKTETTNRKAKKVVPKEKTTMLKLTHNPKTEKRIPAKHNLNTKKAPLAKLKSKKANSSQQKNTLLQLAALLNSQDNSSKNKNRLESLLK